MKTTYLELDLVGVSPEHGPGHQHLVHLPVQRRGVVARPDGVDGGARRQRVQELEAAELKMTEAAKSSNLPALRKAIAAAEELGVRVVQTVWLATWELVSDLIGVS